MTIRPIASLLPLAAALAACGGSGGARAAAASPDSAVAAKVWTPDQARALREARARGDTVPAAPGESTTVVISRPAPPEGEDSVRWAAEEKASYERRVRSMAPYADCMAQARTADAALRPQIEGACKRLPSAPH